MLDIAPGVRAVLHQDKELECKLFLSARARVPIIG